MKKILLFLGLFLALIYGGIIIMTKTRMTGKRWDNLTSSMQAKVKATISAARAIGLPVMFWDGWRSPEDEQKEIDKGTSKLKDPYNGRHVWGQAADIIFEIAGVPSWPPLSDPRWPQLWAIAEQNGLTHPIAWDGPHLEEAGFNLQTVRSTYGKNYVAYLIDKGGTFNA